MAAECFKRIKASKLHWHATDTVTPVHLLRDVESLDRAFSKSFQKTFFFLRLRVCSAPPCIAQGRQNRTGASVPMKNKWSCATILL